MEEETLDFRGLKCPLPALMSRRALARLIIGACLPLPKSLLARLCLRSPVAWLPMRLPLAVAALLPPPETFVLLRARMGMPVP